MSTKHFTANVIYATKVVPENNYITSSAPGVWSIEEAFDLVKGGNWPNAANAAPVHAIHWNASQSQVSRINIVSTGNATDFGDFVANRTGGAAFGNSTRAYYGNGASYVTHIDTITYASGGNATDYGNANVGRYKVCGGSNDTRGIIAGGLDSSATPTNNIQYGSLDSTGSFSDFGNLGTTRSDASCTTSTTRALIMGGTSADSGHLTTTEKIEIATTGNGSNFGNLGGFARNGDDGGLSSGTRAVIAIGKRSSNSNIIEYYTIASASAATDFGDLTVARQAAGASSKVRGIFCGGVSASGNSDTIDYITIGTTGNATDFGDLAGGSTLCAATSAGHGGLA